MARISAAIAALLMTGLSGAARADPQGDCRAAGGTYLTGVVVSGPEFRHGHDLRGVELSHTHLGLRSDQDHRVYDVAIDDVFAPGYDQAGSSVPAPLTRIHPNDRLELCGKPYSNGTGIDWVHTNCGDRPSRNKPDGWTRIIAPDGTRGENLEASSEYCNLWRHR
jgi:hypothetical protein